MSNKLNGRRVTVSTLVVLAMALLTLVAYGLWGESVIASSDVVYWILMFLIGVALLESVVVVILGIRVFWEWLHE